MSRYFKIFLLNCQHVFQERGRSFVWFLLSLTTPLIMILFWAGAGNSATKSAGWNFSSFSLYYLLIVIAGSFLISHTEENIAYNDIQKGELSNYLLKPIPYYWIKFAGEIPYRLLQGFFGVVVLAGFIFFFKKAPLPHLSLFSFLLNLAIITLAYFLCYTYKVILGLLAFWITEINGAMNISEVVLLLSGGFIVPLTLLPQAVKTVFDFFPFPYIVYYPVAAVSGKLSMQEVALVIGMQSAWLGILTALYYLVWHAGIKEFTAVGR